MFTSFSNGTGSAFENSLDSGYPNSDLSQASLRDIEREAVGNLVAETGRDFGTTVRHD